VIAGLRQAVEDSGEDAADAREASLRRSGSSTG
jgi:hypothetical protein